MLLFRAESDVRSWCEQHKIAVGAIFELERLWKLARIWYGDRLDANWRRKTIPERDATLGTVGLRGPFWRLTGDS